VIDTKRARETDRKRHRHISRQEEADQLKHAACERDRKWIDRVQKDREKDSERCNKRETERRTETGTGGESLKETCIEIQIERGTEKLEGGEKNKGRKKAKKGE